MQLKCRVKVEVIKRLIIAFVFSRLDYCNAILSGLPMTTIASLQRVQNAATRLVLGLSGSDYVCPALKELHWLPVVCRIKFKLALVMFTIHTPVHRLADRLPCSSNNPARYVSARRPVPTILFHLRRRNLATELSLWQSYLSAQSNRILAGVLDLRLLLLPYPDYDFSSIIVRNRYAVYCTCKG